MLKYRENAPNLIKLNAKYLCKLLLKFARGEEVLFL
jgi:hypothetical protein